MRMSDSVRALLKDTKGGESRFFEISKANLGEVDEDELQNLVEIYRNTADGTCVDDLISLLEFCGFVVDELDEYEDIIILDVDPEE